MNPKLHHLKNERGVTALETAIILIAFVVVAAIFAFTVLSTGTFLTERSKEATYAALQEVRGSLALKGGMVLESSGNNILFTLAPVSGGESVDVSQIKMLYRDKYLNLNVAWLAGTVPSIISDTFTVSGPAGEYLLILDPGKLARFNVVPPKAITVPYHTFSLEIKPPTGGILLLERTLPARIETVTDLF